MKTSDQILKELEQLQNDLENWREKYKRVDMRKQDGVARRTMLGNTISALEGRMEALEWVMELEEDDKQTEA